MASTLPLILFSVGCGVVGQLMLKLGMGQVGQISAESLAEPLALALRTLTCPLVIVGLGLYGLGAAAWLAVLSRTPLSLAYPMLALSYVLIPLLAWLLLGESVPGVRWAGVAVICVGIYLVSRS